MNATNESIPRLPPIPIVFEDDDLLVLNKPPGVVVNRARSVKVPTLQDWMEARYADNASWQSDRVDSPTFHERSGMVHRLDKDTSGIILFAKRAEAMETLMRQFKQRKVQKTYRALVHGHLPTKTGKIDAPIERHPQNREKFAVTQDGRDSVTHYQVQQEYAQVDADALLAYVESTGQRIPNIRRELRLYEGGFSLVELYPKTGRTHQIRVHMQFLHCPLVGDERYAGRRKARLDALWCPRQWLHAYGIRFHHPRSGEELQFLAPLPADLQFALEFLRD